MIRRYTLGEIDDCEFALAVDKQVELIEIPVDESPGCEFLN